MNFVIIHFNTPELTTCLCYSLVKHHPDANIIIFDNSDKRPFDNVDLFEKIKYLDNTKGQIINFDKEFIHLDKDPVSVASNNLGSAKHCFTVDYLIKNLHLDEFCLLDSDVLIKKKIDFIDNSFLTIGALNETEIAIRKNRKARILPYIQYFNAKKINNYNISYFDPYYIVGFDKRAREYDTGSAFLRMLKPGDMKYININDYIVHFKGGSWAKKPITFQEWLLEYKSLWQMT